MQSSLAPTPTPAFVRRMELTSRCTGESRASQCPVDLTNVLNDAAALQQLVVALFRPFEQMHVGQVVALLVDGTSSGKQETAAARHSPAEEKRQLQYEAVNPMDCVAMPLHRFTTTIAGAIAGAKQLAYGEVTVLKSGEAASSLRGNGGVARRQPTVRASVCQRIVSIDCPESGLCVELKRRAVGEASRVLLVVDCISEVDSILAARDAITRVGGDVVGVSCVLATNASLLLSLKAAQMPYSCSWTPSVGAELSTFPSGNETGARVSTCVCHQAEPSGGQSSRKRQRSAEVDPTVQVRLSHRTAEYQANKPGEDRSVNIIKVTDEGVRINAVFDGHGGSRAVEHLRASLCQRILADVSSANSSKEVTEIVKNAFARCDEELKQSLMALSPEIRMSKGYCNAGSCAVVALFVNTALYVANLGDCAAVLGMVSKETGGLQAVEVSVDHSCNNPQEARLVVERSRDRKAIRLSKDDQANGVNGFGVKRVAGSLAITRAFGDFYLKCEELSSAPFKSKVPYITAEPSITTVYMDGSEKFVILASDGLWEVMTAEEAAHIVDKFDPGQSLFFSTASAALIHAALEKIAHRDGLMIHELMAMTQGPARRRFHDDITCTVVYIDHDQSSQQQSIGRCEGGNKPVV